MKREVGDFIDDIIKAIDKALKFVERMFYEEFANNDKTAFVAIRDIEIIGKAVKNILEDLKKKYSEDTSIQKRQRFIPMLLLKV